MHDKINEILQKKGIEPIRVNIRMNKRKASEDTSPTLMMDEETAGVSQLQPDNEQLSPGQAKTNTCKLCGQVIIFSHWQIVLILFLIGQITQNRKRLLKHYCITHYIDRLNLM